LTNTYKVMGNILQRQASERAKRAGALGREEFAISRSRIMKMVISHRTSASLNLRNTSSSSSRSSLSFVDLPGWPSKLSKVVE
jgi:hypothetical protein